MAKELKNVGASVRARLLQLAKASGQSFDLVLTRFALERLLFRLGQSPHSDRFVLKGAMLMMSWFEDPHRGTRDLDLLGFLCFWLVGCDGLGVTHDLRSQEIRQFDPRGLRIVSGQYAFEGGTAVSVDISEFTGLKRGVICAGRLDRIEIEYLHHRLGRAFFDAIVIP